MEIQVEEIKEFLDACHKAKRIAEMMPELPEGMTPRHVHVIDAIYQLERTGEMVKVSDVSEYLEVTQTEYYPADPGTGDFGGGFKDRGHAG